MHKHDVYWGINYIFSLYFSLKMTDSDQRM
ncbi:hypothetical protein CUJ84_Chr003679 [Rhizobium leguminosarum]|uniref:Uncharacterized protein n=1 Tax=Rhizobium leguminosarum TaxID=384 RepID=A0A2K9Z751_RHILE|nr:hypothetical protein CUJ84_Chr003679 [Rhizobium leguminosarum]